MLVPNGSDVLEVLFDFTQRFFVGQDISQPVDLAGQEAFFDRLGEGALSLLDAHRLKATQQRLLHELLTQYVMFLQMNGGLQFPSDFLEGSSKERLGPPVLNFIRERRWPFPQLLLKQAH